MCGHVGDNNRNNKLRYARVVRSFSCIAVKLYHFRDIEANKESVMASSYRDTLDSSDRVRYDAKLSLIGNRDPYAFKQSD